MLTYTSTSPNSQHPSLGQIPSREFRRQDDDRTSFAWMPGRTSGDSKLSSGTRAVAFGREAAAVDRGLEIKPADVVSRRAAAWRGMRVEVIQCVTHDKVEFRFRAPCHLLLVYEEGVRDSGETVIGDVRSTLRTLGRKLTFVPAGHEYREWQQPSVRSRVICFYFDPAKLPIVPNSPSAQLSPRLFFENNMVWETAVRLAGAIEDGAEQRYSEALGIVVAHELLRTNVRRRSPARGGLAAWQQRQATNFIEEHLAEPVPLAALAGLVNLSTYYFCRAFKQSFGVPPHRYHTLRRIERAKVLLANPDQSITETALALGFSETSSFSAAFRHVTGTTPTAYRRTAR
jgi:AraC family transcriptional regulator